MRVEWAVAALVGNDENTVAVQGLAPDLIRPISVAKMNPAAPVVIHEVLPTEMLAIIFEEHAKLEWRAPAIDGQVCRIWKQIVLNTPRAWAYLEIKGDKPPRMGELRSWLLRSGTAPLHIRVNRGFTHGKDINGRTLYDLLGDHHARVVSLRLHRANPAFFEGRPFPCLRLLDVERWYPGYSSLCTMQCEYMPELQSLRLHAMGYFPLPWSELAPLKVLALYYTGISSIPSHSQSLTTLMLDHVSVRDVIRGPVALPSLTYLSLQGVVGLKSHLNVPSLVTYHEGWATQRESFSAPVPSLVEYGVRGPKFNISDDREWHRYFPNVLRLAIRARPFVLVSSLRFLSCHPYWLPILQTISVKVMDELLTEEDRETMESLIRRRSEACEMEVALYFETKPPFRIPLFFGEVRHCLSRDLRGSDAYSRARQFLAKGRQGRTWIYLPSKLIGYGRRA